jgi:hypothetical protein
MIVQITCVKVGHRQAPKKQKAQGKTLGFLFFYDQFGLKDQNKILSRHR